MNVCKTLSLVPLCTPAAERHQVISWHMSPILAPEIRAINMRPRSRARFLCRSHLARKTGRRFMTSKLIWQRCKQSVRKIHWWFIFTSLHSIVCNAVSAIVIPSVTRVNCDKTNETSAQILKRSMHLVFWHEKWLVGDDPSSWKFGPPNSSRIRSLRLQL